MFNRTIVALALILLPLQAYAYIDPGSGMLLIQGLIAAIGAALMFIRNPIKGTVALFRKLFGRNKK